MFNALEGSLMPTEAHVGAADRVLDGVDAGLVRYRLDEPQMVEQVIARVPSNHGRA